MPVEPGERELVHPFVQHGLRPNGIRDVLVFAWSPIRHSGVHGYPGVRPHYKQQLLHGEHVWELSGSRAKRGRGTVICRLIWL